MSFVETLLMSCISIYAALYFFYYILNIYQSRKPLSIRKTPFFPTVSLIIPTYNEQKTILRKLENLKCLVYPKKMLEVLIIDSSSDDTQKIIKENKQNFDEIKIQLLCQQERMGKASAINCALQHCHGEIIIISDSDAIFEKDAINNLVEYFVDPVVGGATGKLVILNADYSSSTKLEKSYRSIFEILRMGESKMDSTPIFNGPIMSFRRDLIEKLDTETIADDTEISMKIRKKGFKSIYVPEAVAYENTPVSFASRLKQKVRRGQGVIQSFIRHKDFLFNPKYGRYGFVIFPFEFFMHIISPVLFFLITIALIPLSILVNPNTIIYLVSMTALLLILSAIVLFVQKIVMKKNTVINPISLLKTFLNHQFCLLLGLSFFLLRKSNYKWEKLIT